jgi:hypothetical protein
LKKVIGAAFLENAACGFRKNIGAPDMIEIISIDGVFSLSGKGVLK